jgi:hypothetical protein
MRMRAYEDRDLLKLCVYHLKSLHFSLILDTNYNIYCLVAIYIFPVLYPLLCDRPAYATITVDKIIA